MATALEAYVQIKDVIVTIITSLLSVNYEEL